MVKESSTSTEKNTPLRNLFRDHWKVVLVAFGVASLNAVAFYVLLSYMPTYLSEELGFPPDQSFLASSITLAAYIGLIFLMGHISDAVGRKKMLIFACILFIVGSVPLFAGLNHTSFLVVVLIEIPFVTILTTNDGTLPTFLAESFPTEVRYSGFAVSFNMANALLGGTAPLICTWLISVTGSVMAPAWYLVGISVLALGAMIAAPTPVEFVGGEDVREDREQV